MNDIEAVEAIARHAIAVHAHRGIEDDWDNYPELGENDWERVVHLVDVLSPLLDYPDEAVKVLAARADTDDQHSGHQEEAK